MIRRSSIFLRSLLKQNKAYFGFKSRSNIPFADDQVEYTRTPMFQDKHKVIPTFQVMDLEGNVLAKNFDIQDKKLVNQMFETMIKLEEMDTFLLMTQRQGKISFYMPSFGESACVIGSAAALNFEDLIFAQYREQGALLWRGYEVQNFVDQCCGNINDVTRGRQMPVHYSSLKHNWATVSSPLTTQVPQASGAGYGYRIKGLDRVAVTYFGEGAASEGDFHSALNFAATLRSQTLFICRNNKYAISTPVADQYRGDGIAGRGPSYAINTIRVDGNDAIACYQATKLAREYIVKEKKPALIEFMTYRIGDHSTSDHSVLYRHEDEIESWKTKNNPINRLGLYLKKKGWREFDQAKDEEFRKEIRKEVRDALKKGTTTEVHAVEHLFSDVYDKITNNLQEQKEELFDHLTRYGDKYKLGGN